MTSLFMTNDSELNPTNFKRISIINWLLCIPLLLLFTWPYIYIARITAMKDFFVYSGAALFAIPFMITILHGHVTMALGSAHRHHYYKWLSEKPLTYGVLFHPTMMRTRFRLGLLSMSLLLFLIGYILNV